VKHLVILVYAAAVVIGTGAVGLLGYFTIRSRNRVLGLAFLFYGAYTLDIFSSIGLQYIQFNVPELVELADSRVGFIPMFFHFIIMFAILVFCVSLTRPRLTLPAVLAGGILSLSCWVYNLIYPRGFSGARLWGIPVVDIIFFGVIILSLISGFAGICRLGKGELWLIKRLVIIGALFFPLILNDDLPWFRTLFRFSPVMYAVLSLLLIIYLARFYLGEYHISPGDIRCLKTGDTPGGSFFARYGITGREQEIALLVLQGWGNKKIADSLCISLSTVKSHIYSLYKKTGVPNRFELMHLAKNHTEV
jgi:DNA-binding CsgD family transcriptional regulator